MTLASAHSATIIDTLTQIWEKSLGVSSIKPEDNFFDLGGDPDIANRLFVEIRKIFGLELSPLTIYQAPNISLLSVILEKKEPLRLWPVVQLRPGRRSDPVFMIHGLGGSVMEFFPVVRYIESDRPIYGLQSKGIDGVDPPCESIEDLAKSYVSAIRNVQPHGPYTLIGYSLGGLVCLELAQQLSQQGEQIELLTLIEAYPHRTHLPVVEHIPVILRVIKGRSKRLLIRQGQRIGLFANLTEKGCKKLYAPETHEKFTPIRKNATKVAYEVWQRYRPRPYRGEVHFIRATEIAEKYSKNPAAAWKIWMNNLLVETVPGDHLGILGIEFKRLASVLSRYLKGEFQA